VTYRSFDPGSSDRVIESTNMTHRRCFQLIIASDRVVQCRMKKKWCAYRDRPGRPYDEVVDDVVLDGVT
jgi:hypothetical protein